MKAIFIKAGHGLSVTGVKDPGAVGNGMKERDITQFVARGVIERLKEYEGFDLVGVGIDEEMTLPKKVEEINKICKDKGYTLDNSFLLSIHVNAGGGTGTEAYIWDWYEPAQKVATTIVNKIVEKTGLKSRGVKGQSQSARGSLATISNTTPLAVLVELGFIDSNNPVEVNLLKKQKSLFIEGIVEGIVEQFQLKKKETEKCDFWALLTILENSIVQIEKLSPCPREAGVRNAIKKILQKTITFLKQKQKNEI